MRTGPLTGCLPKPVRIPATRTGLPTWTLSIRTPRSAVLEAGGLAGPLRAVPPRRFRALQRHCQGDPIALQHPVHLRRHEARAVEGELQRLIRRNLQLERRRPDEPIIR